MELTDEHGLAAKSDGGIDVQAIEDHPPSIVWQSPVEQSVVTPTAMMAIQCTVKDDLAVQHIELRYLRTGKNDEEETVSLLSCKPIAAASTRSSPDRSALSGDQQQVSFQWDLSQLADLWPATRCSSASPQTITSPK